MTMSLETKLVVSSIALLAVVSAVIATATTLLFNDFLIDRLDMQVGSAAGRSTSQPPGGTPPEAREVAFLLYPGQAVDTFGARVRRGTVRGAAVLTGVGTVRQVPAPAALARVTGKPVTIGLGPLGDYRMVGVRTPDGDVLVTGLPVTGVQATLTRLVVVEAAVTLAGVALTAVAGTLLVRRAVRPLGRLAATAARVSELPLATGDAVRLARVPEPDTDPRTEVGQVTGDADRLHQVVTNLLANARTHTPPGTTVTTTVLPGRDRVSVQVADDGPGIPPHVLPNVFGRFARGDGSRSRLAGGSGLGLAIVSAVAAAHGGRVEVRSVPGDTVFTLVLPASRDQVPPGERGPADAQERGGDQRVRDRGGRHLRAPAVPSLPLFFGDMVTVPRSMFTIAPPLSRKYVSCVSGSNSTVA